MPASLARAALVLLFLMAAPSPSVRWLVIAASSQEIAPVLASAKMLKTSWPNTSVIASQDCSNLVSDLYLAVVSTQTDRAQAQADAARLKLQIPDAYVRVCTVRSESRLQLGIPLLDPSIEKIPDDVVNWTDADRLSQVFTLPADGHLWVRRKYQPDSEDPNEGRRTTVLFFAQNPAESHQLESDCPQFSYTAQANRIAISCARAVASDNLFHTIDVFRRPRLEKFASVEHCRNPQLSASALTCEEEQVGPDGKLRLTPKHAHLADQS
jgi:hypothetical protein